MLKNYGDKVRFVYRDYPLPFHEHARPAAEAALCANEQGKFWEYHDKLLAAKDLSAANLSRHGRRGRTRPQEVRRLRRRGASSRSMIDKDVEAGQDAGVNGTPAFFINGRMLDGAQPFEKFKEVIDEELEAKS